MRVSPGDSLRVRGERWCVLQVSSYDTCAIVEVSGTGRDNRGATARFILPFEPVDVMPAEFEAPKVVRKRTFRRVARQALAQATPGWTSLRAAARARIALLPYQLEPALAIVRGLACRALLADAVGLGKTVQAGLLIAELLARQRDARVLVVTPAGLRDQWQEELRERFAIHADVFDAAGVARLVARIPAGENPWTVAPVILTSIDFVKRPDVIRSLEPLVWDLVAFDEAHGLAGRSDRAAAAELLARRARRVVAVTATPHSGDAASFHRLCALGQLGADDPLILFRRSRASAGLADRRAVRLLRLRLSDGERALHRALEGYARRVWRDAPLASAPAARLAMMVLARRASSSAFSLARSIERRLQWLRDPEHTDVQLALPLGDCLHSDEEPGAELAVPGLPDAEVEGRELERIHALARQAMTRESKPAALARLLRRAKQPAIVFTEYRDTLTRLHETLAMDAALLHGGMASGEREREIRRFTRGDARLLLATDAASEGLNLHHRCRLVINLEVPWTPLRLEQRIGRVDRVGQARRVHAIGLIGRDTAEESVLGALAARTVTAQREAPFDALGAAAPPMLRVVNLCAEAANEAARLHAARQFAGREEPPEARRRPLLCVLTRRRARVHWAVRLNFVDGGGCELWHTLIGAVFSAPCAPPRSPRDLRGWYAHTFGHIFAALDAELSRWHVAALEQLRRDLSPVVRVLLGREQAIREAVHMDRGRLAASLVQPGLFDTRALRDAAAQRRIVAELEGALQSHTQVLHRLTNAGRGERRLLFIVAA